MHKYRVECILHTYDVADTELQQALSGCGEDLEILTMPQTDKEKGTNFKIQIFVDDPTIVFDACAEFGRIRSVKVEEK
jgi:hypothetical protein